LFSGDKENPVGQISSYRMLDPTGLVVINFVLISENHLLAEARDNYLSHRFMEKMDAFESALNTAIADGAIQASGNAPFDSYYTAGLSVPNEPRRIPIPSLGVFLFQVFSGKDDNPADELRKLGPIFQASGLLTADQAIAFDRLLQETPLRQPWVAPSAGKLQAAL
jgi:hypothetical protein